jgi:hypothetical protein
MALARFFDKAALAATDAIQGVGYSGLRERMDRELVALAFDHSCVNTEGATIVEMLTSLLARLYPRVAFVPLDAQSEQRADRCVALARAINPAISIENQSGATRTITVGGTPLQKCTLYVGSDGWTALASRDEPTGVGRSANPFGAALAACVGAGCLFVDVFEDVVPRGAERALRWRILDAAGFPSSVELHDAFLVGVGAVGNSAAWSLARVPNISGVLHVVDPERVELSNLQRYVIPGDSDIGSLKVDLAARALRSTALDVQRHAHSWAHVVEELQHRIGLVAVAVDSEGARREVQASLPRYILNAWTQPGDLGVSRHEFVGNDACLMCLYLPSGAVPSEDAQIAAAIGLPEAVLEVRQRLHANVPLDRAFLSRIAAARGVPTEGLIGFEGRPLRDFYVEAICGGVLLRLGGSGRTEARDAATPLAHQSAAAGVLLAAELVGKASGLLKAPPPVSTRYNVLRPLTAPVNVNAAKDGTGKCICRDPDFVAAFQAKHAS